MPPSDHSIPASLERVQGWLAEDRMAADGTPAGDVRRLLVAVLRL